jgi:hypothetical protein
MRKSKKHKKPLMPMRIPASWFGSLDPPHTRMWHEALCTNPQLPSDFVIPDTPKCAVVLGAIKDTGPYGWR